MTAPYVQLQCTGCRRYYRTRIRRNTTRCPHCRTSRYVPANARWEGPDDTASGLSQQPARAREPVAVDCTACGHEWQTQAAAGAVVRCPKCRHPRRLSVHCRTPRTAPRPVSAPPRTSRPPREYEPAPDRTAPDRTGRRTGARPTAPRRPEFIPDRTPRRRPAAPAPAPVRKPAAPRPPTITRPVPQTYPGVPTAPAAGTPGGWLGMLGSVLGAGSTAAARAAAAGPPTVPPVPARPARPARPPIKVLHRPNDRGQCEVHFSDEPPCTRGADGALTFRGKPVCSSHYEALRKLAPKDCQYHPPTYEQTTAPDIALYSDGEPVRPVYPGSPELVPSGSPYAVGPNTRYTLARTYGFQLVREAGTGIVIGQCPIIEERMGVQCAAAATHRAILSPNDYLPVCYGHGYAINARAGENGLRVRIERI